MNSNFLRRMFLVVLAVTLLTALPSEARKRRSVRHPTDGSQLQIAGTVVDSVTGAPVVAAKVDSGDGHDTTDSAGRFDLGGVGGTAIDITVSRSGYATQVVRITQSSQNIVVRLVPTATVTLRKINGTTLHVDYESLEFGYLPTPFAGYRSSDSEDFCTSTGAPVVINKSEMRRIIGPGTLADSPCCTTNKLLKVNVELKNGTKSDMYFTDLCEGAATVDLIARDHVTGKYVYVSFKDIAELTFP